MLQRFNLKMRLTIQFLGIGLIPILILGFVANWMGQFAIDSHLKEGLDGLRDMKKEALELYLRGVEAQLTLLSNDTRMQRGAAELGGAYHQLLTTTKLSDAERAGLRREVANFYNTSFASEYKSKNSKPLKQANAYLASLSDEAVYLQYEYIARNNNPMGSKYLLERANDRSEYSRIHSEYHPYLREYMTRLEFYDIIIADLATGEVVYTVAKEVDLGSNLIRGPNGRSSIGKVLQDLQRGEKAGAISFGDFASYYPSYDQPSAFVGTTIIANGRPTYALIFQLSIEKINSIMALEEGLGKTGESYLVGSDLLMRSDSFHEHKFHSVVGSFRNPTQGKLDTYASRAALEGRTGVGFIQGYAGYETLSAYTPIDVFGTRWALIAEMSKSEAHASTNKLALVIFSLLGVTAILVAIVGSAVGSSIASPVLRIARDLGANSEEVGRASVDLLRSSEQLSEMAEEQAESINETAASTDEIAAMVENNLGQASSSTDMAKAIKDTTDQVDSAMEKLQSAMEEIRDSNGQIQELVTVIGEIAEKSAVIDEIVFQTKLLSFNASVEAERAGEHGRGFAVVAQEVGNLAKMSGKASVEITSMVKESVKKAERITRINTEKVALVGQMVAETEKLLSKIGVDAEQLLGQAQQILASSREQAEGIKQINEAMNQLEQATRQNSSAAHSTAAASDELRGQASHLSQNVQALLHIVSHNPGMVEPMPNSAQVSGNAQSIHEATLGAKVHPIRGHRKVSMEKNLNAVRPLAAPQPQLKQAAGSEHTVTVNDPDGEWEKL